MHPIILLIVLVAGVFFFKWLQRQPPKTRTKALIYAGIAVLALLVATGRLNPLMGAIVAGLAMMQRVFSALQMFDGLRSMGGGGSKQNQSSDIETVFLRVSLDHDSGDMEGDVIKGQFSGRALSSMTLDELGRLFNECVAGDQQSAAVLDAYLNRRFGSGWRDDVGAPPASTDLTREQAYEILGLASGATEAEIIDAHRRLVQKLHPDRGGSTFLAAQINRAKDILLNK